MISFECPSCQSKMQAAAEHAGMTIECPTCQARMAVPPADATAAAVTATPAPESSSTGVTTPEAAQTAQTWKSEPQSDDFRARPLPRRDSAAAKAGIGVGMILLIVLGFSCVCLLVPGAIAVVLLAPATLWLQDAQAKRPMKPADAAAKIEIKVAENNNPPAKKLPLVIAKPPAADPLDEARCLVHKQSGTKFYYPKAWDILEPQELVSGTSLGLRKDAGDLTVTLFWRATMIGDVDEKTRVNVEVGALKQVYGAKVSEGEAIQVGEQLGHRIQINGPPPGIDEPNLRGVVYLFFIKSAAQQDWTLKLRATAKTGERLQSVDELLHRFQWK